MGKAARKKKKKKKIVRRMDWLDCDLDWALLGDPSFLQPQYSTSEGLEVEGIQEYLGTSTVSVMFAIENQA